MGPDSGHDLERLVAASAGKKPAAAGDLVGQVVNRGVRCALRIDGQLQAGQRVEPVRIAAVLADQDLRLERPQQRRHDGMEGTQPSGVRGPAGSATLTADPSAPGPNVSAGSPVPGHSVAGCSCRLIVSTRGSS